MAENASVTLHLGPYVLEHSADVCRLGHEILQTLLSFALPPARVFRRSSELLLYSLYLRTRVDPDLEGGLLYPDVEGSVIRARVDTFGNPSVSFPLRPVTGG